MYGLCAPLLPECKLESHTYATRVFCLDLGLWGVGPLPLGGHSICTFNSGTVSIRSLDKNKISSVGWEFHPCRGETVGFWGPEGILISHHVYFSSFPPYFFPSLLPSFPSPLFLFLSYHGSIL